MARTQNSGLTSQSTFKKQETVESRSFQRKVLKRSGKELVGARHSVMSDSYELATPRPAALIESLRAIGYNLPTAIADIVDNSISAKARNIYITFHWAGSDSWIRILDDGRGMSEPELFEAMRPGSKNPVQKRAANDLGRFGLGLKTASFSQARRLTVASRAKDQSVSIKEWDLDYVEKVDEWRLLTRPSVSSNLLLQPMESWASGTVVFWAALDRLIPEGQVSDAAAHARFNDAIDQVRDHLALTFHRFLEDRTIKLFLNETPIAPWDPFMRNGSVSSSPTPEEFIPFGKSGIKFQGFVLPHKDALGDQEFQKNGGPRGWTAQQGFYVYRNKRLLVYGDWLRLGCPSPWTREEHYRLARIRLDISNDTDAEWHLDVKKSTARPPALIRDRLQDLGENVRATARSVFAHRGKYGKRTATVTPTERPWLSTLRENRRVYAINRDHPAVQAVVRAFPDNALQLTGLLRLLEETVPVEQIWLDTAEQSRDHAAPYAGVEFSIIKAEMRRVVEFLVTTGINRQTAIERLRSVEPFDRYPKLINEL